MILYPAIDLYGGHAVRLLHGDYAKMTVYHNDPCAVAREFAAAGATHLHLVDLEGAKTGSMPHLDTIRTIRHNTDLFTEVGGGIRSMEAVDLCMEAGIDRVILGTAAVTDRAFLCRALEAYGERVAVGADIKEGKIAIRGWLETADLTIETFCTEMQELGVRTMICTDVSRDGAMRGANHELYRSLSARFSMQFIASGGVSSLDDVRRLAATGLHGAIIGKAYYTGAISLPAALKEASK